LVVAGAVIVGGAAIYAVSKWGDKLASAGRRVGRWVTLGAMGLAGWLGVGSDVQMPSDQTLTGVAGQANPPAVVQPATPPETKIDTASAGPKRRDEEKKQ
jgi:hypothetical protein